MMRFNQRSHSFYCVVDLHARTMHVCVFDADARTQEHFLLAVQSWPVLEAGRANRERFDVSRECLFTWYWLADSCREEGITF